MIECFWFLWEFLRFLYFLKCLPRILGGITWRLKRSLNSKILFNFSCLKIFCLNSNSRLCISLCFAYVYKCVWITDKARWKRQMELSSKSGQWTPTIYASMYKETRASSSLRSFIRMKEKYVIEFATCGHSTTVRWSKCKMSLLWKGSVGTGETAFSDPSFRS